MEVGDVVLSKSDVTGEISYKRVVNTFIRQTQAIYKVTFEDGTILETTWNHPFRRLKTVGVASLLLDRGQIESMDLSEWTEAKELKSGDLTFTADGKLLAISSIEVDGREETVYNFEVEDFHTYFVGEIGVWVHNQNYSGAGASGSWNPLEDFGKRIKNLQEKIDENSRWFNQTYASLSENEHRDKKETDVDGKPQKTGTNGHAETIAEKTLELRDSGEYDKIYLNKGINRVLGEPKLISPNRRPDIVGVRKDGRIDLFEVPSKTDKDEDLTARMQEVLDKLPEKKRGKPMIVPIDKKKYPRDKK